jgi:ABC-type transport system involved in multi-copper enzyme maturation permease subunit
LNTFAIAGLVRKEIVPRPLHLALLALAAVLILLGRPTALFGFGQEAALLRLSGIETIALYAFWVAVLFGAGTVGRDIESRLLVSILAKPITRRSYVLGRFLGLVQSFALGSVPLAVVLLITLALGGDPAPGTRALPSLADLVGLAASIALALVQAAALAAAVLALSVLLPSSLGLVVAVLAAACGLIAEPARQALSADAGIVTDILARIVAIVLPPISRPGEGSEVAFGSSYPFGLVAVALGRAVVYAALALALASWRLRQKDLT